jgi:hypothetical protein
MKGFPRSLGNFILYHPFKQCARLNPEFKDFVEADIGAVSL